MGGTAFRESTILPSSPLNGEEIVGRNSEAPNAAQVIEQLWGEKAEVKVL